MHKRHPLTFVSIIVFLDTVSFGVTAILTSAALIIFFQQIRRLPSPAG